MIILNFIFLFFSYNPICSGGNEILISIEDKNTSAGHVRTYYLNEENFSIFEFPYPNLNNQKSEEIYFKDLANKTTDLIKHQLNSISMSKDFKSLYANLCLVTGQHFNVKFLQDGKYHSTLVDHYYESRI